MIDPRKAAPHHHRHATRVPRFLVGAMRGGSRSHRARLRGWRSTERARLRMPVFHAIRRVRRRRLRMWKPRGIAAGWKAASPCRAPAPARARWTSTEPLKPQPGDRVIVKPRFSAFFATQLDLVLRRLGVGTVVVLIGTTTPNCIRNHLLRRAVARLQRGAAGRLHVVAHAGGAGGEHRRHGLHRPIS